MKDPLFIIIDLFCGCGGVTTGFIQAMYNGSEVAKVVACINHDHKAILSHWANHPEVKHFEEDIRNLDLTELSNLVAFYKNKYPKAYVILWASLECTEYSKAKGGLSRDADSRTLAKSLHMKWDDSKKEYYKGDSYIQLLNPDFIMIENVVEFRDGGPTRVKMKNGKPVKIKNKHNEWVDGHELIPEMKGIFFKEWCKNVCELGYHDEWKEMNSADYGAFTSRNRLFGMFAKIGHEITWPEPTHSKGGKNGKLKWNAVKEKLDFKDEGYSIFHRANNPDIPKRQRKDLVDNTLERIYAGCIKHIAGGKEAFLTKYHGTHPGGQPRTHSVENPLPVIDTQNRHSLVNTSFISKYFSGKPDGKNISVDGPAGAFTTKANQALVQLQEMSFLTQRNGGNPNSKTVDINGPARTVTSTGGNQDLVQAQQFLSIYHGSMGGTSSNIEEPAGALTAADIHAVVQASFISKKYSGPENHQGIDQPAGSLTNKDTHALVQASFIDRQFSGGGQNSSVEEPVGSITGVPKLNLIQAEHLVDSGQYTNTPVNVTEPAPVITANRKYPYLLSFQYQQAQMQEVDRPAPVILATSGKTPQYLLITETGEAYIQIYETDSEIVVKLKEFMALYNIVDIKMRMLRVDELLKIQGFPDTYNLLGTQEDQKKFIGNSVVPQVVKAWTEALALHHIDKSQSKVA